MLNEMLGVMENWDKAKEFVIACLRKKTIGSGQVTKEFVDMEEYVRVDFGMASTVVTEEILEKWWSISEEELFAQAEKNMSKYRVLGLSKMLGYDDGENDVLFFLGLGTGTAKPFGAGVICNKNVLEDVRMRMNDDFYVIPSSIHEVLVISSSDVKQIGADDIRSTIGIINQKEVADDEVLSNNLYEYTAKHGLRIAW